MLSTADIKITREKNFAISCCFFFRRSRSASPLYSSFSYLFLVSTCLCRLLVWVWFWFWFFFFAVVVVVEFCMCVLRFERQTSGRSVGWLVGLFGYLVFKFNKISIACNVPTAIILSFNVACLIFPMLQFYSRFVVAFAKRALSFRSHCVLFIQSTLVDNGETSVATAAEAKTTATTTTTELNRNIEGE